MAKARSNKPANGQAGTGREACPEAPREIQQIHLQQLHFDWENPRFANEVEARDDAQLLDRIVKLFGIEDVLSSIAVNGYMPTEPLVGVKCSGGDGICIKEGNRRLAALLILADDPRAKNHANLRKAHPPAEGAQIDPVPVLVYENGTEPRQLLPYLGVRHIVGSRPWDSYAKAAWVASMLESHGDSISLEQVETMTGDTHGTIARLLEGYYLVRQLVKEEKFFPNDSYRKGRGSAVNFPFSWVYNALGYTNVKEWIGLTREKLRPNPVAKKYLDQGGELMVFMFGRKSSKITPVIAESRELGDLALCLGDARMVAQLRNNKTVRDVMWSSKSGLDRVLQSLVKADDAISDALGSADELSIEQIHRVEPEAHKVYIKSRSLYHKLLDQKKASDD